MKFQHPFFTKRRVLSIVAILVWSLVVVAVGEVRRIAILQEVKKTTDAYQISQIDTDGRIQILEDKLAFVETENSSLKDVLADAKEKNENFQDKIGDLTDTVDTLDKLSKTDPQLLQKYSKVYFLNEHYVPVELDDIATEFRFDQTRELQIHADVSPHLEDMLEDAQDEDLDLKVVSAYRSYGTQSALKASYKFTYGAGTANQFSADQGYSEHQLGTTIDIATPTTGASLNGFDSTAEFKWLEENAQKYGFTLSYPKGNAYYVYEPWHWRYVGIDLAKKLKSTDTYFYDMDQRTINSYLAEMF